MKYLDLTFADPKHNLACDEALGDNFEAADGGEVLRLWEPADHFVVLGYSNRIAVEVNVGACEVRGIPILRRFSGGGAVVQGPGCLNYTLVLGNERPGSSAISANLILACSSGTAGCSRSYCRSRCRSKVLATSPSQGGNFPATRSTESSAIRFFMEHFF